jgi:hypothetical protein
LAARSSSEGLSDALPGALFQVLEAALILPHLAAENDVSDLVDAAGCGGAGATVGRAAIHCFLAGFLVGLVYRSASFVCGLEAASAGFAVRMKR